jgi:RNA polymerase sigma factor (sigma-70 family)
MRSATTQATSSSSMKLPFASQETKSTSPLAPASQGPYQPSETREDETLVWRAMGGDAEAQDTLFGRHRRRLYRIALRLLRSKEDAEDAVQDALLSAYRNLGSFEGRSMFSTWLTRIVVNAALVQMRRRRARPEFFLEDAAPEEKAWMANTLIDSRADPEQAYGSFETHLLVERALEDLSPSIRVAFQLRELKELSNQEAAKLAGVEVGAFKSRISRARSQLAERFSPAALAPLHQSFPSSLPPRRAVCRESAHSYAS